MKVQILQLKPHDDNVSAREKLSWVKADRALLVWPRRGEVLQRKLDLVLLLRKADEQGVELGLVTHDPSVRDHAARLRVPVFDSVDSLPEARWSVSEERQPLPAREEPEARPGLEPPDTPRRRAGRRLSAKQRGSIFALGLAAFLSLLATFLPSATLIVTPQTESRRTTWRTQLDLGLEQADPASSKIPARLVQTEVSGSMRAESTGFARQPSSPARGEVIFSNLTEETQTVPAGTSVRTAGSQPVRFVTLERVVVVAGRGEQAEVEVEAAEPGRAGNVGAGSIQAVDGPLGLALEVDNPQALTGGSSTFQPAVTSRDLERLRSDLMDRLLEQAAETLREELRTGQSLAASSLRIDQIVEESYDRHVGDIGASVGLDLTVRVSALAYESDALRSLAAARVPHHEPPGWSLIPGSLAVQINETSGSQAEGVVIRYGASWTAYKTVSQEALRAVAAGAGPSSLDTRLERGFGLEDLQVRLTPRWLPRLPWLATRIRVVYPWEIEL